MAVTSFVYCCLLVSLLAGSALGDACKGCLNFDEDSFRKVVPKFKYSLIKFDIAYPYGPKHDAFVQFAETLTDMQDLIVADVGIKDYGQKDNEDFAKAQKVDTTKLPVIKLYKGIKESIAFTDDEITIEKLREFVLENSDVHLTLPGCVEALDKLAIKFTQSKDADRKQYLKEVEDYLTETDNEVKAKQVYSLYMKKLLEDEDFVGKEQKRLKKILTEGQLAEAKKQILQNKINILYAFEDKTNKFTKRKEDL